MKRVLPGFAALLLGSAVALGFGIWRAVSPTSGPHIRFLLLLALLAACHNRQSPEQRARQAVQAIVKAVAARDLKPIAAFVSDQYQDDEHNDKQQVVSLVRVQFVLHPNIYLLTRIASLECPDPTQANVVVFAAMASVPPSALSDLSRWSGDVFRFELDLVDENGTWRVRRASWTPASAQDLL